MYLSTIFHFITRLFATVHKNSLSLISGQPALLIDFEISEKALKTDPSEILKYNPYAQVYANETKLCSDGSTADVDDKKPIKESVPITALALDTRLEPEITQPESDLDIMGSILLAIGLPVLLREGFSVLSSIWRTRRREFHKVYLKQKAILDVKELAEAEAETRNTFRFQPDGELTYTMDLQFTVLSDRACVEQPKEYG